MQKAVMLSHLIWIGKMIMTAYCDKECTCNTILICRTSNKKATQINTLKNAIDRLKWKSRKYSGNPQKIRKI